MKINDKSMNTQWNIDETQWQINQHIYKTSMKIIETSIRNQWKVNEISINQWNIISEFCSVFAFEMYQQRPKLLAA